jgi:hypothetical protein
MFPSQNPLLCILQLLVVGLSVVATLVLTGNPLALFGLMLIWHPPALVMAAPPEHEEDESSKIGFNADIE